MPPFSHSILDCFLLLSYRCYWARCHSKLMHGWQPSFASIATFMIEAKCPHAQLEDWAKCPKNTFQSALMWHWSTATWKIGAKWLGQSALMWHWQPLERLGKVPSECLASQSALMWHWQPLGRLGNMPSHWPKCPHVALTAMWKIGQSALSIPCIGQSAFMCRSQLQSRTSCSFCLHMERRHTQKENLQNINLWVVYYEGKTQNDNCEQDSERQPLFNDFAICASRDVRTRFAGGNVYIYLCVTMSSLLWNCGADREEEICSCSENLQQLHLLVFQPKSSILKGDAIHDLCLQHCLKLLDQLQVVCCLVLADLHQELFGYTRPQACHKICSNIPTQCMTNRGWHHCRTLLLQQQVQLNPKWQQHNFNIPIQFLQCCWVVCGAQELMNIPFQNWQGSWAFNCL